MGLLAFLEEEKKVEEQTHASLNSPPPDPSPKPPAVPTPPTNPAPLSTLVTSATVAVMADVDEAGPEEGPFQEYVGDFLDAAMLASRRRPAIFLGLMLLKGLVDMAAPVIRQYMLSKGWKVPTK